MMIFVWLNSFCYLQNGVEVCCYRVFSVLYNWHVAGYTFSSPGLRSWIVSQTEATLTTLDSSKYNSLWPEPLQVGRKFNYNKYYFHAHSEELLIFLQIGFTDDLLRLTVKNRNQTIGQTIGHKFNQRTNLTLYMTGKYCTFTVVYQLQVLLNQIQICFSVWK